MGLFGIRFGRRAELDFWTRSMISESKTNRFWSKKLVRSSRKSWSFMSLIYSKDRQMIEQPSYPGISDTVWKASHISRLRDGRYLPGICVPKSKAMGDYPGATVVYFLARLRLDESCSIFSAILAPAMFQGISCQFWWIRSRVRFSPINGCRHYGPFTW